MYVSIVAVHGLNPKNTESHAEKTWTSEKTNKLWLRDFLPSKVPYARIFIFGYNSNVALETSSAGLSEQAENLLNLVTLERLVPNVYSTISDPSCLHAHNLQNSPS